MRETMQVFIFFGTVLASVGLAAGMLLTLFGWGPKETLQHRVTNLFLESAALSLLCILLFLLTNGVS